MTPAPEGAVRVLKSAPLGPRRRGLYLLRAEGVRPVIQNELHLRVWLAFRHQGRTSPRLVPPPSHLGVGIRDARGLARPPRAVRSAPRPAAASGSAPRLPRGKPAPRTRGPLGSVVFPARKPRSRARKDAGCARAVRLCKCRSHLGGAGGREMPSDDF